jgi:CBS domain-containing protein
METIQIPVTDFDVRPVAWVGPETSVAQAAALIAEADGDTLVVDTEPLSEVTERDLVVALAGGATGETMLGGIRHSEPRFVPLTTTAEEAATIMIATGRRSLVVVDHGRPFGVIKLACVAGTLWGGTSWLGALRIALHVEGRLP